MTKERTLSRGVARPLEGWATLRPIRLRRWQKTRQGDSRHRPASAAPACGCRLDATVSLDTAPRFLFAMAGTPDPITWPTAVVSHREDERTILLN